MTPWIPRDAWPAVQAWLVEGWEWAGFALDLALPVLTAEETETPPRQAWPGWTMTVRRAVRALSGVDIADPAAVLGYGLPGFDAHLRRLGDTGLPTAARAMAPPGSRRGPTGDRGIGCAGHVAAGGRIAAGPDCFRRRHAFRVAFARRRGRSRAIAVTGGGRPVVGASAVTHAGRPAARGGAARAAADGGVGRRLPSAHLPHSHVGDVPYRRVCAPEPRTVSRVQHHRYGRRPGGAGHNRAVGSAGHPRVSSDRRSRLAFASARTWKPVPPWNNFCGVTRTWRWCWTSTETLRRVW